MTSTMGHDPEREHHETIVEITKTYYDMLALFERWMGVSRPRWQVLRRLHESGQLTQADLQQRLNVDPAAVSRQVKQLEAEGLVTRRADPRDNRYLLVQLTDAGAGLVQSLLPRRGEFEFAVLEGVDEADEAAMRRAMARIRANIGRIQRGAEE